VVVRPTEIDSVLVNPGMGIQTFQRFNGQALLPGQVWSEEGPTERLPPAPEQVAYPGSSLAYLRWFWETIEPEKGRYRWDIVDLALAEARAHEQALAIRIMPYDAAHPLPAWYRQNGARRANRSTDKDGAVWQPDFGDARYLLHWGALVAALGARYDGHPDLDTVDISSIGYWGEGWSPYMPDFAHQKALIDIWIDAFPRTPLLMNFDEPAALAYGRGRGVGYRLDCLGDMRTTSDDPFFPPEMLDVYPQQTVRAGVQEVWRRRPVSFETCWVPSYWQQRGWDVHYILDQALRWHVTSLNPKSAAIPPEWRVAFDDFQKKMGYRFILRRLEYPRAVRPGQAMMVHMWWHNAGVAPVYRHYELALGIASRVRRTQVPVPVDLRTWLPGDAVFDGPLTVPGDLAPGDYRVQAAMLDPRTHAPAIRLAIEGRLADGWYDLGEVTVRRSRM
jgi:hypothetical protein